MDNSLIDFNFTRTFLKQWQRLGLSNSDREDLKTMVVNYYMKRPQNTHGRRFPGAIVSGTGGAYKLRYSAEESNSGKSGSYRTLYFVMKGPSLFFLCVYAKGQQETLSDVEKSAIRSLIKKIKKRG